MAAVYCTFVAVIRLKEIKTRALSKLGAKIFRKAVILSLDLFSMPYYDSKGRSLLRYLKEMKLVRLCSPRSLREVGELISRYSGRWTIITCGNVEY